MNEWYEQAAKKLEDEKKSGKYDQYAQVMKDRVNETLVSFCKQDREFAQAVVQGGAFEECMKAVSKDARSYGNGHGIPDLEAFRRAVQFYFPGADVRFQMSVNLCASVDADEPTEEPPKEPEQPPKAGRKILDLEDFL